VLVGARNWRRLSTGQRFLVSWFILGLGVDLASIVMGRLHVTTVVLYLFFALPSAWLGLGAMGHLAKSQRLLQAFRATAIGYTFAWIYCTLRLEDGRDFSHYAGPLLWLLLTVAAVALLVARFRTGPARPFRDPVVLTGVATVLSFAPLSVLEPVSGLLYASHKDLVIFLWEAHSVLLIASYLIYTRAVQWTETLTS
jgi:hypothetical protein